MRRHVLFIVENHAVPLDRRVTRQAIAAKEWGYDVSVICCKEGVASAPYEKLDGIDIYRHPMPSCDSIGKFAYVIEYGSALFWELLFAIRLYLKHPFHVIHAANPPDTIVFVAALFKPFGVKFIFDVHDLSPELFSSRYGSQEGLVYKTLVAVERLSCKLADSVITTNESYSEIIAKRHNVNPERTFVVRNDPSVGEFSIPGFTPETNEKKVILFLGSINEQDGVCSLMESIDYLVNVLGEKNITCVIIGCGQGIPKVKQKISALRLEEYVDFKGVIWDRAKVSEYLNAADVCVEPAPDTILNRHSTFIKILEFMGAGKPIVAYDLKESRFSAGDSAVFVKPGDVEGFARAIKKLLDDPALAERLGRSGQARVNMELNWRNSTTNMKKAYDSLEFPP